MQLGPQCALEWAVGKVQTYEMWADMIEAGTFQRSGTPASKYLAALYRIFDLDSYLKYFGLDAVTPDLRTWAEEQNAYIDVCNLRARAAPTPSTGTSASTTLSAVVALIAPIAIALACGV